MIAKISRGWRIGGLVRYLMGPGRFNEHTDQRVVASWDGDPARHQPQAASGGGFDVTELAAALADPGVAAGIPQRTPPARADGRIPRGPVWHCSLRNADEDEPLSDEQWAEIVEELMDRTGIAGRGDGGACRWVAIRHGGDHVHVAAMLVRQDNGRRVHPRNDYVRAREVCRAAERRLGLSETAPADRTAAERSSRAEHEKAQRRGASEPSRDLLRRAARLAAVRARDTDGYFAELRDLGVMVRPRPGPDGAPVGYAVALPGDINADAQPIWFAGGSLARDLTLPQLRRRWASAPDPDDPIPPGPDERSQVGQQEREGAIAQATASIEAATNALRESGTSGTAEDPTGRDQPGARGRGGRDDTDGETCGADGQNGDEEPDAIAHATGDMVEAVGAVTTDPSSAPDHDRRCAVGDDYDRAARIPVTVVPRRWAPVAAELRRAAWRLAAIRRVGGAESAAGQQLIAALAALVAEVAALREQQHRTVQACAARRSWRGLTAPAAPSRPPSAPSGRSRRPGASGPGRAPTGARTAGRTTTSPVRNSAPRFRVPEGQPVGSPSARPDHQPQQDRQPGRNGP